MKRRPSTDSDRARTSRGRLLFIFPFVLLIVCVIAGFLWWQRFKATPAYSIALLVDAAPRNDATTLDQLFDRDQVVKNFLSDMARNPKQGYSAGLLDSFSKALQGITPGPGENVKSIVREGIRRRIIELSEESANKPFVVKALAIRFKAKINQDGNKATATINRDDHKLELALVRHGDRLWRVTSVKDDELAARIIAEIAKQVPGTLSPGGLDKTLPGLLPPGIPFIPKR